MSRESAAEGLRASVEYVSAGNARGAKLEEDESYMEMHGNGRI